MLQAGCALTGASGNLTKETTDATSGGTLPTIGTQPANTAVNAGQTATFSIVASGTGPLSYQWSKNGTAIAGATSSSYTTAPAQSSDNGAQFIVTVSNSVGAITSSAAILTVSGSTPPTITAQPASQTVTSGQTATFAVVATGPAPLTYQWQKNGTAITGATASSYTTPATTSADSGTQFTVVVSDSGGNVTSAAATLTVNVPPLIATQPISQTDDVGQTATFSVVATGSAPITYQWQKNGIAIAGATSASYTTPSSASADNGTQFTVVVTDPAGTITSNAATLTVDSPPSITTQPASQSVTASQTATFSVVAAGTAPLTYQWQKNGAAIAGATSSSYTTPATTSANNGSLYAVVVSNVAGSVTSASVTLTVNTPPSITTQPNNQTVALGQAATFTVVAAGTAPLTYQWQKNSVAITGATSSTYTTPAAALTDSGSLFSVVVTNVAGNVVSSMATLTVDPPPSITTQPASQTVTAGQTATFTVVATGLGPLSYQWQKSGAAIAGATSASYTTPATASSDNGSQFTVIVTNPSGSVTSSAATLTVNTPPSITTQPANQSVTAGQTATFSVAAAGTAPLSYQWRGNGTAITGATASSYTTPATTTSNSGTQFTVMVTNLAGSVTSSAATLTVTAAPVAPSITTQPSNQSVAVGQTAMFSVVASGTAPLSYQWQKNGTAIGGATASTYTTPATAITDNGSQFVVVVTNSAGNVTSSTATLTVNPPPTITTQPASQTVTAGQTATFSVVASGSGTLTYQWQKNGAAVSGATSSSYTTPATTSADNGSQFTVVVSNSAGNVSSSAATLTVNSPPSITTQPASQTVTVSQTATFSVVATGTAPLSYQWRNNGTAIAGATSSSYTTPATTSANNGNQFTVVVTNSVGSVTSNAATLTVNMPPSITTQPSNQTVAVGQTATFSVVAAGTAPLSYQWRNNGTAINGATSASYTTPATTSANNGNQFTVVVTNSVGSVTSSAATLTVNTAPSITTQPVSQTVNAGQTATFSVVAAGTAPLTYQWQNNGTAIGGATSASYTTPATTSANNGNQLTAVVTNAAGNVTSSAATLTVNTAPSITTQPVSQTVNAGQTATFSVVASGTAPLTYQWKNNGTVIAGATSSSYTTPATTSANNGNQFTVVVTNTAGNVTSSAATLTVNTAPSITTQPVSQTVTAGQTATFSVVVSGTAPLAYQWQNNGTAIAGATSATYTTPATTSANNGNQFSVTASNSAGNVTSSAATLTVNTPPSITTQPANQTAAAGQTATFSVVAAGTAPFTYQWKNSGTAIGGATSSSYTTPVTTSANNGNQFTVAVTNAAGGVTSSAATLTVSSPGQLTGGTSTLAFSSVNVGNSSQLSVTFTNSGTASITISNVMIGGAGFTASGISSGQIIGGGQTATLTVTFAPSASGAVAGSVSLSSNASNSPASVALTGTGGTSAHWVGLTWVASPSSVTGFNVYRATAGNGPFAAVNSSLVTALTYDDSLNITAGQTYYYVVTAVDSENVESVYSNEISVTTP